MARSCLTIILAAGEGTRMRATKSKVLHEVAARPMVLHVAAAANSAGAGQIAVVVGPDAQDIRQALDTMELQIRYFEQTERLGTAHAVLAAREALASGADDILILFGDTPLLRPETLQLLRENLAQGAHVVALGFRTESPGGYGRLLERDGALVAIREDRDASPSERGIEFCNGGIMGLAGGVALELLERIGNDNAKGEFYLTQIVEIAHARGLGVKAIEAPETELMGVNSQSELATAERVWQTRRREELLQAGVSMQAPETVFFAHDTIIGQDSRLEPNIHFGQGVMVGKSVQIRAFSHLEGCEIGDGAVVGPFARLRPGTRLGPGVRVGNFCEVKNAEIGEGAKINHLSYIGDASVGGSANIGAGTITCNYDGFAKSRTEIGQGAFVGSNSSLVAPVRIGDGAYVGSGSVVTEDVPDNALAIARERQVTKEGYASTLRKRAADGARKSR